MPFYFVAYQLYTYGYNRYITKGDDKMAKTGRPKNEITRTKFTTMLSDEAIENINTIVEFESLTYKNEAIEMAVKQYVDGLKEIDVDEIN